MFNINTNVSLLIVLIKAKMHLFCSKEAHTKSTKKEKENLHFKQSAYYLSRALVDLTTQEKDILKKVSKCPKEILITN